MDRHSAEWITRLKPWLTKRIETLRDELETPGSDVQHVRGQIAELRNLIRTVDPDDPLEGTSGVYFPPAATAT